MPKIVVIWFKTKKYPKKNIFKLSFIIIIDEILMIITIIYYGTL